MLVPRFLAAPAIALAALLSLPSSALAIASFEAFGIAALHVDEGSGIDVALRDIAPRSAFVGPVRTATSQGGDYDPMTIGLASLMLPETFPSTAAHAAGFIAGTAPAASSASGSVGVTQLFTLSNPTDAPIQATVRLAALAFGSISHTNALDDVFAASFSAARFSLDVGLDSPRASDAARFDFPEVDEGDDQREELMRLEDERFFVGNVVLQPGQAVEGILTVSVRGRATSAPDDGVNPVPEPGAALLYAAGALIIAKRNRRA